jgi:transcriptional regulator with XRE-family HTH domain
MSRVKYASRHVPWTEHRTGSIICPVSDKPHPLGAWLRELREKKHMSQDELAQAMGLDSGRRTISRWESGASEPGAANLLLLFDALGVHVSPLLDVRPRALNAELAANTKVLERLERKLDRQLRAERERTKYYDQLDKLRAERDRAVEAAQPRRRTA